MKRDLDDLLAEQLRYYRARASEYDKTALLNLSRAEVELAERETLAAIDAFSPEGDVLELACGPGTWTAELLRYASTLTALDGSPEMLELARVKVHDERVRFLQADIFHWRPDRRYDVVFFAFWLSHVPLERFESFWQLVCRCLKPGGRVFFLDDAFRTPDELIEGEDSAVILRRLTDGTAFRAFKVPHTPQALQRRLVELGWQVQVTPIAGPIYCGAGSA